MDQFFYWSGVVLWATSGLFMLIALAQYLEMNVPGVLRVDGCKVYSFGIGEVAIISSASMAGTMARCGFRIRRADGYWWCAKVFRFML